MWYILGGKWIIGWIVSQNAPRIRSTWLLGTCHRWNHICCEWSFTSPQLSNSFRFVYWLSPASQTFSVSTKTMRSQSSKRFDPFLTPFSFVSNYQFYSSEQGEIFEWVDHCARWRRYGRCTVDGRESIGFRWLLIEWSKMTMITSMERRHFSLNNLSSFVDRFDVLLSVHLLIVGRSQTSRTPFLPFLLLFLSTHITLRSTPSKYSNLCEVWGYHIHREVTNCGCRNRWSTRWIISALPFLSSLSLSTFIPTLSIRFHPSVRDITLPVCPVSLYLATLIFSLFSVIDSIALVVSRQVFQQRERQSPIPIYPLSPLSDMLWICFLTRNNEIFIFNRKYLFE